MGRSPLRFSSRLHRFIEYFLPFSHELQLFQNFGLVRALLNFFPESRNVGGEVLHRIVDQDMGVSAVIGQAVDCLDEVLHHGVVGFSEPQRNGSIALGQVLDGLAYPRQGTGEFMGIDGAHDTDKNQQRYQRKGEKDRELKDLGKFLKDSQDDRENDEDGKKKYDESGLRPRRIQVSLAADDIESFTGF
jgi:hypothetical protein